MTKITDSERLRQTVELVLDRQVRPLLKLHGGGIALADVAADGVVRLEFEGACRGCALKSVTYALGVRQKLLPLPGVREVQVNGVRLSDAALARVEAFYGRTSPWVGVPQPGRAVVSTNAGMSGLGQNLP